MDIELNDINIETVCKMIYTMRKDVYPALELQDEVRSLLKDDTLDKTIEAV